MSIKENKKLVRHYFEDSPHNPDICDEIFAPSFQFHAIVHTGVTPQTVECTPESEKAFYEQHKSVWDGWQVKVEEMIAEGDRVVVHWSSQGTHVGETHGLPPTGKQVTNSGVNIFRLAEGKIVEMWDIWDRLWLWQQLGVLPDIKEALTQTREASLERASEQRNPYSTSAKEEMLQFFVGDWRNSGQMSPGPFGPGGLASGETNYRWDVGGKWLLYVSRLQLPGLESYQVHGGISFNHQAERYDAYAVNSLGNLLIYEGVWTDDATLVFELVHPQSPGRARIVYHKLSAESFKMTSEAAAEDGTFAPYFETTAVRA